MAEGKADGFEGKHHIFNMGFRRKAHAHVLEHHAHGRLDASGGAQHPGCDPRVLHDPVRGPAGALVVGLHDEILILEKA